MDIRYFEAGARSLLGTCHLALRLRTSNAAVVLCNPSGEEAMRVHRSYRVLAGKLQEAGYPTIRFDYSGTGDSSGESIESTVEHWLDDIEAAANEIQRRSGSPRIVLVGLRFGATLAIPVNRNNSIKLYASQGVFSRTGNGYDLFGIAWQYRWGAGL